MAWSRRSGGTAVADDDGQRSLQSAGRGPARWWPWAVGVLVLAWLAGVTVSAVVGDGEPEPGPIDPDSPYTLVVLSVGRLRLLDLATGEIQEHRFAVDGVFATDNHLIVADYRNSPLAPPSLTVLGVDEVSAGRGLDQSSSGPARRLLGRALGTGGLPPDRGELVPAGEPDHVWVVVDDGEVPARFQRIDLAAGVVVEERPVPGDGSLVGWPVGGLGSVDLLSSLAGGVYEWDGDGYQLVAPGRVLVSDETMALVEQCDERFRCRQQWYERSSWEPVARAVPPSGVDASALHGGRWLVYRDRRVAASTRIFDIETGQTLDLELNDRATEPGWSPISPDGEWAVHTGGDGRLVITRLSTMKTIALPDDLGPLLSAAVTFIAPG